MISPASHRISPASRQDFPEILKIYNEVIRNSTAVYTEVELTAERGEAWFEAKLASGFPMLAARDDTGVTGFGSFGEFRAWPCYRHSVEHSVHVRCDRRGQGIGRSLVIELMSRAAAMQKHVMIAGVDADNAASIKLHESLGFINVGHFHEVGFKFGRWLDLVFLQCRLPATNELTTVKPAR
ncbi:MAG TPA: GNAT family N-acetyltransferase [Steroidobacteraceae bacterium]|jgi:phosphinothricin acetyltransferase|nr:GNAT family N-acetyltransferase [Steroidobacteraceae bacterium]